MNCKTCCVPLKPTRRLEYCAPCKAQQIREYRERQRSGTLISRPAKIVADALPLIPFWLLPAKDAILARLRILDKHTIRRDASIGEGTREQQTPAQRRARIAYYYRNLERERHAARERYRGKKALAA